MYCKHCGAPSETEVCSNCAAQRQPAPAQPAKADPMAMIKQNLHYIIAGLAVLAFLIGILNVFSVFDVSATISNGSRSESNYVSMSEAADAIDSSIAMYIGNIVFGLASLAAAAIGILYFLKAYKNMPLYDQYIGSKVKFRPAFMMGALVAAGVVWQFIMYLFCGDSQTVFGYTMELSFGINWTSWVMLVIFGAVAVADKVVLEKSEK